MLQNLSGAKIQKNVRSLGPEMMEVSRRGGAVKSEKEWVGRREEGSHFILILQRFIFP